LGRQLLGAACRDLSERELARERERERKRKRERERKRVIEREREREREATSDPAAHCSAVTVKAQPRLTHCQC